MVGFAKYRKLKGTRLDAGSSAEQTSVGSARLRIANKTLPSQHSPVQVHAPTSHCALMEYTRSLPIQYSNKRMTLNPTSRFLSAASLTHFNPQILTSDTFDSIHDGEPN
jgi:hypothetical protein